MKIIVLWFFLLFSLHANETLTALFEQLKSIKKEDKFKIVNEIKMYILKLKEQERFEAIKALQAKKEAKVEEVHDVIVERLEDNDVEVKMQEHIENMDSMDSMDSMEMPVNMVHMEKMNTMFIMEDIKERQAFGIMGDGASSVEGMRDMMGNR